MPIDRINWLAVLVGGIIYFVWGYIWYGLLFAKQWSTLSGVNGAMTGTSTSFLIVAGLMALVLSFGVAVALSHDDNRTAAHGAQFGIFFGVFFFASVMLTATLAEGRPVMLWIINAGYVIIGLVLLGLLHGAWKKAPRAAT